VNEGGKADHIRGRHRPNKSLDRSGGSVFRNLLRAARLNEIAPSPVNSDVRCTLCFMTQPVTNTSNPIPEWLLVGLCILFLTGSFVLWLSLNSTLSKIIYYISFFLPTYACGEYLGSKIFSRAWGLSISEAGFSPLRIFVGVCFVLGFFVLVYGVWFFMQTLLIR
jgi:hypothetical protein